MAAHLAVQVTKHESQDIRVELKMRTHKLNNQHYGLFCLSVSTGHLALNCLVVVGVVVVVFGVVVVGVMRLVSAVYLFAWPPWSLLPNEK